MRKDEKEAAQSYKEAAEFYHYYRTEKFPKGWFFNEMLEMPATLSLLGNVKGKKLLDFGCGTGIYARLLTKKGAIVKGFDISLEMLKIARKLNPYLDLRQGSGYNIPFDEKFEIVQASLVMDYFNDWNKVFKEVKRILKKGGYFIFSIGNPVSECAEKIKINRKKLGVLGVRSYFKEKVFYADWTGYFKGKKKISVPSYHKTYETIIKTIVRNGFEIVDYKDCCPIKNAKKYFSEYYMKYSKSPFFCVWKVKVK